MKPLRLATLWLSGCSGCHMSLLNLHEKLLTVLSECELVYSPLADFKKYPDQVDVVLVEGAAANSHDVEMIRQVREKTRFLAAMGDCALNGNVPAMRNPLDTSDVLSASYNPHGPVGAPRLLERVLPIHQVVPVDAFLSGCPPLPETLLNFLQNVTSNPLSAPQ